MKKFLLFLLVVGGLGAAGYYFYNPYLEPYLGPIVEKISVALNGAIEDEEDKIVKKAPEPKSKPVKVIETPVKTAPATPIKTASAPPTKMEPVKSEIDKIVEGRYPMPAIRPLMQIVDNWNNVPRNAYPKAVAIKEKLAFTMTINGNKMASVAVPGTQVAPVRIQGSTLFVTSLANSAMKNQINIDKTDFKERVTKRYADFVHFKRTQVEKKRAKARASLEANAGKLAALTTNAGKWDTSGDPRFGPVKAHIASGQVPSVSIEEATSFRWNGSEKVGGELAGSYDTVTVHFEVSTIFGKFPADYKCLLRGGKVVGWIDPVTDEKI